MTSAKFWDPSLPCQSVLHSHFLSTFGKPLPPGSPPDADVIPERPLTRLADIHIFIGSQIEKNADSEKFWKKMAQKKIAGEK